MEIWQNTTGVGVPISAETLRFTSNHVGDIRRYVCDSINKGIMN
jgi:hypothetical protein